MGLADFSGSKFQRMANWPSFDFSCPNELLFNFREESVELADFAEIPMDGQLAQFRSADIAGSKFNGWPTGPVSI